MSNPEREAKLRELSQDEFQAWHKVAEALEAAGTVTKADSQSKVNARETPGQRVYAAIRSWGECLVELKLSEAVHTLLETRENRRA